MTSKDDTMSQALRRPLLATAMAGMILGAVGCHRAEPRVDAEPSARAAHTPSTATAAPRTAAAPADPTRVMGGPPASDSHAMGAAASPIDDRSITSRVNAALAADQQLKAMPIDVDTQNGIVTLSGPSPTATAKEHASEVARTVHGVVSVNNQLTLGSG